MPRWNARAVLFAELNRRKVRRIPIQEIESFSVDSAMDTDADSFEVEIGDPGFNLIPLLRRDNEVRINLFGGTRGGGGAIEELQQGIADSVGITEEGTVVISGRDFSCIAADTIALPHSYTHYRPDQAIQKEARRLGFREFRLDRVPRIRNFYTDGSETVWEKWYRAYRKRNRWLWMEPNGVLRADVLHYTNKPRYRFGRPQNRANSDSWIPVISVDFTTRKQDRVGTAVVIGEGKDVSVFSRVQDKTIKDWVRRPVQIFSDADIHSQSEARKRAFEEIFEAKVGAIEIVITIAHPGFIVRQNNMARLRIPQMGIDDIFFVVGNQVISGSEGVIQKIRLRQKGFAITRRVPDDPELDRPPSQKVTGALGEALSERWGEAFVAAAREFHKPWPFDLFCATLLAICKKETGFRNVRYGGTVEWYRPPNAGDANTPQSGAAVEAALRRHHRLFANSIGNPLNPLYPNSEAAVGPMQLVTPGFKVWADEYGNRRGEYMGGRWKPEANIRAAARALRGKLQGLTVSEANMWYACGFRYYGSSSASANRAYANSIRAYVLSDPGYLGIVREALESAQNAISTNNTGGSWGGTKFVADQFRDIGIKHNLEVISSKRQTKSTSTGGISDHWVGCKECYAYDLSNGSSPTPQMDAAAKEMVRKLGGSYNGRSALVFSKVIDGYRIQILYRTMVGGNHFNHIHVGVRKV